MVENYQARYLVDFGLDVRVLQRLFTDEQLMRFKLQDFIEQLSYAVVDDEALLQAAQANLSHFEVVGITEHLPESTQRIAAMLGVEASEYNEYHNKASGELVREEDLDTKTMLAIADATRVDQVLYRRARQELLAERSR
jgi:hypothetical protein